MKHLFHFRSGQELCFNGLGNYSNLLLVSMHRSTWDLKKWLLLGNRVRSLLEPDLINHSPDMFYPSAQEIPVKTGTQMIRSFEFEKKAFLFWKRCFDLFTSVLLFLVVMTWLIPLVSLLIMMDSRGPVFFSQRRVGRKGKTFLCFKFRTMIKNQEADKKQAMENDSRITRLGKFLRKTNIDEFPQLFNVFLGQMSIVGPRPHMVSDCIKFSSVIPDYPFRDLMKPGMTGLSQIRGFCGPILNRESLFG